MSHQDPAQPMMPCSQCGQMYAHSDLVLIAGNWVCSACKPAHLSRVMAGGAAAASPHSWHYGGFWMRFAGVLIDGILMQVVKIPFSLLILGTAFGTAFGRPGTPAAAMAALSATLTVVAISWLIALVYEVTMIRYYGATLGKMAIGVKVVRSDGSDISWGISIGRYFMKIVSGIILAIGYIIAGFDDEKRALHDRVCDTRVVYKSSLA